MSENRGRIHSSGKPYKLIDCSREHRKGIIASSLRELINVAKMRFAISTEYQLRIVLEQDGKLSTFIK